MKAILGAAVLAGGLVFAQAASAQHRLGEGVMGAVAGGLVAGPVGAIAGGAVGYTQGPHIARGLGIHRRRYYNRRLHHWVWR